MCTHVWKMQLIQRLHLHLHGFDAGVLISFSFLIFSVMQYASKANYILFLRNHSESIELPEDTCKQRLSEWKDDQTCCWTIQKRFNSVIKTITVRSDFSQTELFVMFSPTHTCLDPKHHNVTHSSIKLEQNKARTKSTIIMFNFWCQMKIF